MVHRRLSCCEGSARFDHKNC